jgi:membrane-associated phospholipid phosphatase
VRGFSKAGEHGALWLVLGGAGSLLDQQRRAEWLRATAVVAGAYGANQAVKFAVRRKRPRFRGLPQLMRTRTQLSFPSAHATTSFAAARAFGSLIPSRPLYAVALPMAYSRVYLGVHFPSDVAAGALLGTLVGSAGRAQPLPQKGSVTFLGTPEGAQA